MRKTRRYEKYEKSGILISPSFYQYISHSLESLVSASI